MNINETYLKKALSKTDTSEVNDNSVLSENFDDYMFLNDSRYPYVYRLQFDCGDRHWDDLVKNNIPQLISDAVYDYFDNSPEISDFSEDIAIVFTSSVGTFDQSDRSQVQRYLDNTKFMTKVSHCSVFTSFHSSDYPSNNPYFRTSYLFIRFSGNPTGRTVVNMFKHIYKRMLRIHNTADTHITGFYQIIHKHIDYPYSTYCKLPEFHNTFVNIDNMVGMCNEAGIKDVVCPLLDLTQNQQYTQKRQLLGRFIQKTFREILLDDPYEGRFSSDEINLSELIEIFPNRSVFPYVGSNQINCLGSVQPQLDVEAQVIENKKKQDVHMWVAQDDKEYKRTVFLWIGGTVEYSNNHYGICLYTSEDYNIGQAGTSSDYTDIITAYCVLRGWKSFERLKSVEQRTNKYDKRMLNGLQEHQIETLRKEVNEKLKKIWKRK